MNEYDVFNVRNTNLFSSANTRFTIVNIQFGILSKIRVL